MRRLMSFGLSTVALLVFSSVCDAAIRQQIFFRYDPTPGVGNSGDEVTSGDLITGADESEINRSVLAGITASEYSASGSIGEFGNYGVQGQIGIPGELHAQVFIEADVIAPLVGGGPREAFANFIIDGGESTFIAGPNSNLDFLLTVESSASSLNIFQSGYSLNGSPTGMPTFSSFGSDIGASLTGPTVDIPLSFQSFSLGLINPGEVIRLRYQLDINATIGDFSEVTTFSFQDPLSIEPPAVGPGFLRPTISFVTAIPEPSSAAWLLFVGAGVCLRRGRRS